MPFDAATDWEVNYPNYFQAFQEAANAMRDDLIAVTESTAALLPALRGVSGSTHAGPSENPISEGEQEMPNETLQIRMPIAQRGQLFDNIAARETLMTDLNMENWANVLEALRGSIQPINIETTRGGFRIDSRYETTHETLGRVMLEYIVLEDAQNLVDVASDGKVVLNIEPLSEQEIEDGYGESYKYSVRPLNPLDAAAFAAYAGVNVNKTIYYSGNSGQTNREMRVSLAELRDAMQKFLDYKSRRGTYIRNAMRSRMREELVTHKNEPYNPTLVRGKLYDFITNVQKQTKKDADPFKKMVILPRRTLASRRWGIEIEAVDIHGIETPEGWALHGDGSLRSQTRMEGESYATSSERVEHQGDCATFLEEDLRCNCDYDERYAVWQANHVDRRPAQTGEWNSPILKSFHSRGLKHLSDELEGRYTNDSAGVHVHVESSDLTPDQAVKLTMIYTALEPLFESEYHRTRRDYCASVDLDEFGKRLAEAKKAKANDNKATSMKFGRRYYTVNVAALNTHGTIEFRAMGNIYEYEHLIRWAHFCREMVNIAKADIPQKAWSKIKTFEDVIVMFSKYGKETPTPAWAPDEKIDFEPIVKSLGIETRRRPNSRPSNAYTQGDGQIAPVELFDDYTGARVFTTGVPSQSVLAYA